MPRHQDNVSTWVLFHTITMAGITPKFITVSSFMVLAFFSLFSCSFVAFRLFVFYINYSASCPFSTKQFHFHFDSLIVLKENKVKTRYKAWTNPKIENMHAIYHGFFILGFSQNLFEPLHFLERRKVVSKGRKKCSTLCLNLKFCISCVWYPQGQFSPKIQKRSLTSHFRFMVCTLLYRFFLFST